MARDPLAENIFFFLPNVIGYVRVILAVVSFHYMPDDHIAASIAYILSALLDAIDGYLARRYNQATQFGAILDQLTDRAAQAGLIIVLCTLYPQYLLWFQLSVILDITSHWAHIWAGLLSGKTSHKLIHPTENPILRIYYSSKPVLFTLCAGSELFYGGLYLLYFTEGTVNVSIQDYDIGLLRLVTYASAPLAILKSFVNLIQLFAASRTVGIIDVSDRVNARAKAQ